MPFSVKREESRSSSIPVTRGGYEIENGVSPFRDKG